MPQHFNFKNLLKFDLSFEIWTKIRYLIFSFTCVFYVKGGGVLFSFSSFCQTQCVKLYNKPGLLLTPF